MNGSGAIPVRDTFLALALALTLGACADRPWVQNPVASAGCPGTGAPFAPLHQSLAPGAFGPESQLNQHQQQRLHELRRDYYQSRLKNEQKLSEAMEQWQSQVQQSDPEAAARARDRALAIEQEMFRNRLEAQDQIQQIISEP